MPFNNPYFPSQFDVGTPGGPHVHLDSTGVYAINGNQKISLTPQSPINPNAVALSLASGNGELVPALMYEILDAALYGASPGGDALRMTLFESEFVNSVAASLSLESGSRDGTHGAQATLQAVNKDGSAAASVLVDASTAASGANIGALTWDGAGLNNGPLGVKYPIVSAYRVGITANTVIATADTRLSADLVFDTHSAGAQAIVICGTNVKVTAAGAADTYIGVFHNGARQAWGENGCQMLTTGTYTNTLLSVNAAPAGTHTLHVNGIIFPGAGASSTSDTEGGSLLVIVLDGI